MVLSRVRGAWYFMVLFTMLRIALLANCYLFENTTQCHCVKINLLSHIFKKWSSMNNIIWWWHIFKFAKWYGGNKRIDSWFCNGMQTQGAFLNSFLKMFNNFERGIEWTHTIDLKLKSIGLHNTRWKKKSILELGFFLNINITYLH